MTSNKTLLAHCLALITILIWGTTLVSTKVLLRYFSPEEVIIYRFVLAYAVLLALSRERLGWLGWRHEALFLALGASGVTLYFWTENAALEYTLSANVGLIVSAIPILTAMLAHYLMPDEKFRLNLLLGFAVAMAGIGLIIYNGQVLQLNPLGDVLALGAALFFSVYNILIRKVPSGFSGLAMVRKTFFWGCVAAVPVCVLTGGRLPRAEMLSLEPVGNLLYLATVASALGYAMWNKAIAQIGAVRAANYIYLMPLITMLAAVLMLGEPITPLMLAGGGLILLGVYVNQSRWFARPA